MDFKNKASSINLFSFATPQMRAFHITWFSFFVCFFGWFGLAPLLKIVREDLNISNDAIITTNMVAVGSTVFMRLLIGWLCDRIGPRLAYTWLLILGSLPVMLVGLSTSYEMFLIMRMLIGAIGASFVITQYHTSIMFSANCVGTANATTAGWGNLGGGVTQIVMPLIFGAVLVAVPDQTLAWRYAMVAPGVMLFLCGLGYYFLTQDAPDGNFSDLRARGEMPPAKQTAGAFWEACRDPRVWVLFLIYGACFGVELTVNSNAALYFIDYFEMDLKTAGLIAGLFGLMNLFARTLGGYLGDRFGAFGGLRGRVLWLFIALLCEGIALIIFSRMGYVPLVIVSLIVFSLFVQMSEGATYSVVPFINKRALGAVAGIVGAGGNAGAVAALFLFKKQLTGMEWTEAFLVLGIIVTAVSFTSFLVTFSTADEEAVAKEQRAAQAAKAGQVDEPGLDQPAIA